MTKTGLLTAVGVVGAVLAKYLGGWDVKLNFLLILMAIDFVTGLMVAGIFKKSKKTETGALSSNVGWRGICKKVMVLLFVLIGHQLDLTLGTNGFSRAAIIIASAGNELISITENAGLMGVPVPEAIMNAIDLLKKQKEATPNEADPVKSSPGQ